RVLDLGCRDGALTQAYLEGNEVIGVDADRDALAEAARRGIETHWADLDQRRVVGEVRRVLRPGGTFVASVPNAYRLKGRLLFLFGRPPENDPTHLQMFSGADVQALLAGLEEPHVHFVAGRLVPLH